MSDQTEGAERSWTYRDYLALDDENRYELIGGALIREPAPGTSHQRAVVRLFRCIDDFVRRHGSGEAFIAPVDVIFDEHNTVQPDIVFVARERMEIVKERGLFGAPDMVVEIISPGSLRRDRMSKMTLYSRFGVREYWIVDPQHRSIEIYALAQSAYAIIAAAEGTGVVGSDVVAGLTIDVENVLGGMPEGR